MLTLYMFIYSCNKEEIKEEDKAVETKSDDDVIAKSADNNKKSEVLRWTVKEEDLEDELLAIQGLNDSGDFSDQKLRIRRENKGKSSDYEFMLSPRLNNPNAPIDIGGDDIINQEIVCEGSGTGFALCVRDWLADNKGKCLVLTEVDDTYYADDDCPN